MPNPFLIALATPTLAVGLALAGAPAGHADIAFLQCWSGRSGIATNVTSCPFAENVRAAYFAHGPGLVAAYSPVTGQIYAMSCSAGYTANLTNGNTVLSALCVGGNNAEVVVW